MRVRTLALGALVVVVSFGGATLLIDVLWPPSIQQAQLPLVPVPPLQSLTGASTLLVPVAITIPAIHDALEAHAPKNISGKPQIPVSKLLSKADLSFTVARGPLGVSAQAGALVVTTQLSGTFQARGLISGEANALGGAIGNLIGGNVGQQVQNLAGKTFDQHADVQGTVTMTARPNIAANWRLAPNLAAQVNVADVILPLAGTKLSVADAIKPTLDKTLRDQTNALETQLRNDPFIETAARKEWSKLCRAIPLGQPAAVGAAGQAMPNLWFEFRPVRAIAAQPRVDDRAVTLVLGVKAQTRIVPSETKPECPFPKELELVEQPNEGAVSIAVPIDIPFVEVSRLIEAQINGRTFPQDGSGAFAMTIKRAAVAASGDRLLISLLVNVKKRGFFDFFGADATVNVWGRPVLDRTHQIVRFVDVALDVQSQASFGLLGSAAQAAMPYLRDTIAEQAFIELKPFAQDAKKRLSAAVGDFAKQSGLNARAVIDDLRLTGIAYDNEMLRVIAEADGAVDVAISSLKPQ